MRKLLLSLLRDNRASIAPLSALTAVIVIGFGAFAVDEGNMYYQRRILQSTADLAAIAAAGNLANAQKQAQATVSLNGYSVANLVSVEVGTYVADASLSPSARFQVGSSAPANAARVTLQSSVPLVFGQVFSSSQGTSTPGGTVSLGLTATATNTQFASFSIGTRLASVNGGLLNSMLGALIGSNISLSVMDYNTLLNSQVDLFAFSNALASQVNLQGATYNSLYSGNMKLSDVLSAAATAARSDPNSGATTASILSRIASASTAKTGTMDMSQLIDMGPFAKVPVDGTPLIGASVGVYDLVLAAAQIANGNNIVSFSLGANLAPIASAQVSMTIGERPVGSPWVAVGQSGATVHTAQMRLYIDVVLLAVPPLPTIHLPIYLELAPGTATLQSMTCSPNSVTVSAYTGIVDAWIGSVTPSLMTNYSSAVSPSPVVLINLSPLLQISGLAHISISNINPVSLTFQTQDIGSGIPKTISTTSFVSSLVQQLLSSLVLQINGLNLLGGLTGSSLLTQTISLAASPVDSLIASTLNMLGIGLGQADVWVDGERCDGAVLVK